MQMGDSIAEPVDSALSGDELLAPDVLARYVDVKIPFRLLATDFDGTLWGSQSDRQYQEAFASRIRALQGQGVVWCVATGRRKRSFKRLFYPLQALGLRPDYLIIENAYIYSTGQYLDRAHPLWNVHIRNIQKAEMDLARRALATAYRHVREDYPSAKILRAERDRLDITLPSPEEASQVCARFRSQLAGSRMLMVLQYGNEIRLRTVPFTKGLAIAEIAENIGLSRNDILAIGDGHNDISMLDSSVAHCVGCPSNAAEEVLEYVHQRKGHIARQRSLHGVISILDAFVGGEVVSRLPPTLVPAFLRERRHESSRPKHGPDELSDVRGFAVLALSVYSVLAVLAHFSVIPFGRFILLPFTWAKGFIDSILG